MFQSTDETNASKINTMANDNALRDDHRIQGSSSGNQEDRYDVLILIKSSISLEDYMHHF